MLGIHVRLMNLCVPKGSQHLNTPCLIVPYGGLEGPSLTRVWLVYLGLL